MTNRIRCALLALAAAAAAEGADEMILKVYDLGPLAVARRARFTGEGPGPAERDFSLLGTTQQQEAGRDGEDVEEDAWDPAPQVIEIVRTFVEEGELQSVDGGRRLLARMKEADHRTVATEALSHLRPGDTLVIWKLDRLGRTVKGLVDFVTKLEAQDVNFHSITDKIDTSSTAGRFFFHIMASLSQMEGELTRERTKAGLASARAVGRIGGRQRRMTDSKIEAAKKLLISGKTPRDVAKILEVSVPTLYRWIPEAASLLINESS